MRRLFMFSVSVFLLALTLLIGLHQGSKMARAGSAAPVATEVVTVAGQTNIIGDGLQELVLWPNFPDGTAGTDLECDGMAILQKGYGNSGGGIELSEWVGPQFPWTPI